LNFGGIFRAGVRHPGTGLTLRVHGYDGKVAEPDGSVSITDDLGLVAASWKFAALAKLWNRKHAQAVYVPAECRTVPTREYRYGSHVNLGEGTDFLRLIAAVAGGFVYYDPGIKLEGASTEKPSTKRRSQFRIKAGNLPSLYATFVAVDVSAA
jgi:hypothetical protein